MSVKIFDAILIFRIEEYILFGEYKCSTRCVFTLLPNQIVDAVAKFGKCAVHKSSVRNKRIVRVLGTVSSPLVTLVRLSHRSR